MDGRGWSAVRYMAAMAARLLDLNLRFIPSLTASRLKKLRHMLLPARHGTEPGAIYFLRWPVEIKSLMAHADFNRPRRFRALFIVESFWTDRVPSARLMRNFDLIMYMQKGDAAFYEALAPGRALYVPWGADVLDLGSHDPMRSVDVLRVGRQPEAWDDDARTSEMCQAAGLQFAGRPPAPETEASNPLANHPFLCGWYAKTKFVMAQTNLSGTAHNTHKTREYYTGRWVDALAAGATVAGQQPLSDKTSEDLLWPGATLHFEHVDLAENVEMLKQAVAEWTPQRARHNHLQALRKLDWRWRLAEMADRLEIKAPALDDDISRLQQRISEVGTSVHSEITSR